MHGTPYINMEGNAVFKFAVKVLEELGVVAEQTGQKRGRSYSYGAYVGLLVG